MKIVILNQAKNHHKYLIKSLSEYFSITAIVVEKKPLEPKFETFHPYENEQDIYEKEVLLKNENINLSHYGDLYECENINDSKIFLTISKINPDVILTVGTNLIKKPLVDLCPQGFINLHGGDSQYYRGLDSFLWSMYHADFSRLVVTLHHLNNKLDDGDIILQKQIRLNRRLHIHKLRAENIKVCFELVKKSLSHFNVEGQFHSYPQKKIGRYYSFMPAALKDISIKKYNNYIAKL